MPSISDPLDLIVVLAAVVAAALLLICEPQGRTQDSGMFNLVLLVILFAAALWLWSSAPGLLLIGALVFCLCAMLARPEGTADCCAFACVYLIAITAAPIAGFMSDFWPALGASAALLGLAFAIGKLRKGHTYAIIGAWLWSFAGAGAGFSG